LKSIKEVNGLVKKTEKLFHLFSRMAQSGVYLRNFSLEEQSIIWKIDFLAFYQKIFHYRSRK